LQIDVHIPLAQEIKYQPGFLETLKFGWVQILAMTVPCVLIFFCLTGFLFRHQILETSVASELVPKKRI